jgi:hypothetical protein
MLIRRARGRRAIPAADVRGFPWRVETPLYHATVALGPIRQGGLKTRDQLRKEHHGGVLQATGGGTDSMISFTLDYRVALAIVVGLETFRRIAQGLYTPKDFLARLESEVGAYAVSTAIQNEFGLQEAEQIAHSRALLARGMKRKRHGGLGGGPQPADLPPGSEVVQWWHELLSKTRAEFETPFWHEHTQKMVHPKSFVLRWNEPMSREETAKVLASIYKASLAFYEKGKATAYNPLFMLGSMRAFTRVRQKDIGVVEATTNYGHICAEGAGSAMDLASIPFEEAKAWERFLSAWGAHCRYRAKPGYRQWANDPAPTAGKSLSSWGSGPESLGAVPFDGETPHAVTPDTTMLYLTSMREVRLADVKRIRSTRFLSYKALVRKGLIDPARLTYPIFDETRGDPMRQGPLP